jgi:purine-nucleoside phosphorylase
MIAFDQFRAAVGSLQPRAAVVFGSGLSEAASPFVPVASVPFADVPGLVPPTVAGHKGRLSVGHWAGVPAVVSFGRVHFYEGHPWDRVTRLVRLIAECGVKTLVLTNAAGGIRDDLTPGDLMAIRGHLKLLDGFAWKDLTPPAPLSMNGEGGVLAPQACGKEGEAAELNTPSPFMERGTGGEVSVANPYTLLAPLPTGVYAALTGPCYETPAEIRALRAVGADAVGMSTAVEAETAAELGLTVAGISCITNKAAGLSDGPLSHGEVEATAKTAVAKLADLLTGMIRDL